MPNWVIKLVSVVLDAITEANSQILGSFGVCMN